MTVPSTLSGVTDHLADPRAMPSTDPFAPSVGSQLDQVSTADEAVASRPIVFLSLPVVVLATAEGARATTAAIAIKASAGEAMLAFSTAFGFVFLPLVVAVLPVAFVLGRPEVRRFATELRRAMVGDDERAPFSLALAAHLATLAGAIAIAIRLGRMTSSSLSANTSITLGVVVVVTAWLLGTPLAAWVVRRTAPWLHRWSRRAPRLGRFIEGPGGVLLCAVVAIAGVVPLVPLPMLATVAPAVAALVACAAPWYRAKVGKALSGVRWWVLVGGVAVMGAVPIALLGRMPAPVRIVLLSRAPLAGSFIIGARLLVDFDHDGYSPILLGGDCDDRNANVHPGARDLAGNGVDENCSGADAKPYVPFAQPPVVRPAELSPRMSIVLVHLDALRPDHLGFEGYARNVSTVVDRFRQTATWFSRAYTPAPTTRFAIASLFTGLDVESLPGKRGPGNDFDLAPTVPTLAETLGAIGYDRVGYTISYVAQHVHDIGRGFRVWETPYPVDDWDRVNPVGATLTSDAALRYLATVPEDGSKPYLLFLHYRCTHDPYSKNPRWHFGSSSLDDYDSALAYCDDELGRVLTALDARADKASTATIVYSDHGELFGEHGLTNHSNSLYEPELRTLLLARIGTLKTVDRVAVPVSLTDLAPTILMLAGAPPSAEPSSAWNLLPLLTKGDEAGAPARPLYFFTDITHAAVRHESRAVLTDRFKYIQDLAAGTHQLFDVIGDPQEETDLSPKLPQKAEELAELLESRTRTGPTTVAAKPLSLPRVDVAPHAQPAGATE
jgi:arylsulfatase A-like enzyme